MSRYVQPASNAASKIGGLKRGSQALRIASARSLRASSAIAAASEASSCADHPRAPSGAAANGGTATASASATGPLATTVSVTAIQTGGDLLAGTGIHLDGTTVHPDGLATVTPGPGNNWVLA